MDTSASRLAAENSRFDLRRAGPGDEARVATVHVRSWQVGYQGLLPDRFLKGLEPREFAARYQFTDRPDDPSPVVLAADRDKVLGFAISGASPDAESPGVGQLHALYVDPTVWNQGVGRALLLDAHRRLRERGFAVAVLWMLAGNQRADRFYRTLGWASDGTRRRESVHGAVVDELRYERSLL